MKVSLVMTVFNGEEYLNDAIYSILNQTYKNLEIIIVNNGSTDSTERILNNIDDKRVKIIHLNINQGISNALNLAISQAQGDWIAIHDADDISLCHRIEEQIAYVKANPHIVAVGSFIECIGGNNSLAYMTMHMRNLEIYKNSIITYDQIKTDLLKGCPITHGSLLMSKDAYLKAGRYDPKYKIACDYDLFTRLVNIGPIENIPKILYKYRLYINSISNSNVVDTSTEFLLAYTKYMRNYCFNHKIDSPKIFVYGTKRGCNLLIKLMSIEKSLNVDEMMCSYNTRKLERAYKNYIAGKLDAFFIFTNAQEVNKVVTFLVEKGLEINKNFFTLWSPL